MMTEEVVLRLNDVELAVPKMVQLPGLMARLNDGSYEADEAAAAAKRARPGLRALELGAGLGYVSTIVARRVGAENLVTVEANPVMFKAARANLDRNGQARARWLHAAVTGQSGGKTARFYRKRAFTSGCLAMPGLTGRAVIDVPRLSLHRLLSKHRPHVVLMDVEGAEASYFDRVWHKQLRFLILELHPNRYRPDVIKRIVDCMSETGLTYDPAVSRGRVLGFRRVWG